MKLAVVNNGVPFVKGGAEYLAGALASKLIEYGHQAVLIRIPFRWNPPEKILESMLACRLLRLPNVDRVVALKFPAYFVRHPDKRLWLLHQFRQAYDLWDTQFGCLPNTPEGRRIREVIIKADNVWLPEASKIYTNSDVTSDRLRRFNGISSEVLYPPLEGSQDFCCHDYEGYIFCPGRITTLKRQWLAVEAMRYVRTPVRLVVAGAPESPDDLECLKKTIASHGLRERVELIPRFISQEEKADWLSRALACVYAPYDEDSYGYVTLEAYTARKAVTCCEDSGGVLSLVKDGETGCVVAPEARCLAAAFDKLYSDRQLARRLGEAGHELIRRLDISWERVIEALTK